MVTDSEYLSTAARILKVLGNPKRLEILLLLNNKGTLNVSEIQREIGIEQSLVSHYLNRLYLAGLVNQRRDGKMTLYSPNETRLKAISNLIAHSGSELQPLPGR